MALSAQALQYVDEALTDLTSQPDPGDQDLSMPWLRRVSVPAPASKGEVVVWRELINASSVGVSTARAPGHARNQILLGDPATVSYQTNERSLDIFLDYMEIGRAQAPLDVQTMAARKVRRVVELNRYKACRDLVTTTANWGANNNATIAALGGSGVNLSNAASTPMVDFELGAQACAEQNGNRRPDYLILSDRAVNLMIAVGLRTVLPLDKAPVREIRQQNAIDALADHLGIEVFVERGFENGSRLWPATAVFGYRAGAVTPTNNGAIVPPITAALIQEQVPNYISGDIVMAVREKEDATGLVISCITSDAPLAVDTEAIYLVTSLY